MPPWAFIRSRGMGGSPMFPQHSSGTIAWSDPRRQLYPPALAAMGIPLDHLLVLHPKDEREELWAAAECMRCRGVSATILSPRRLSRIEARRLQLAAETGGGIGILLRTLGPCEYAAATRWLVKPIPGTRMAQRWQLQLIHGHGGRIGQCVILENSRETNHVRAFAPVADRLPEALPRRRVGTAHHPDLTVGNAHPTHLQLVLIHTIASRQLVVMASNDAASAAFERE